jgi:hypothetical protein
VDNFQFDMTSEGNEQLRKALALFQRADGVTGYRVDDSGVKSDRHRLILYWTKSTRSTQLPYPMKHAQTAEFVLGWLAQADYGRQPDHDGDNGKGWRVYNESWGHVDGEWQAFVAIEPVWAMYGK